jgi:hypothetical protein
MAERVASWRPRVRSAPIATWRAATLVSGGLVVVAIAVRLLLMRRIPTPWIFIDELIYSEYAKSFAGGGDFLIRGGVGPQLGKVYPALISPAWHFGPMSTVYAVAKGIDVVVMSLVVVPVFLWARRLVSPFYATVVAGLTLALPAFVYNGALMTENVFFPLFVLALYALALTLERPTLPVQLFLLVSFVLTVAVRVQAIVLIPVFVTALVLKILFDVRSSGSRLSARPAVAAVRPYLPSLVVIVVAAVVYALWKVAQGVPIRNGLGAYAGAGSSAYSARDAFRWVVYHFAELALLVGVIPASAFIVLFGLAWAKRSGFESAERAFLATAAAGMFWLLVEVGIFASHFSLRIEERNMFDVAPLLLLALVLWLHRGLPRPPGLTAAAAFLPVALLLTLPLDSLLNISILSDTFGLIPFWRLAAKLAGGVNDVRIVLAAGALAAGIVFAVLPRRIASVLAIVGVAVFLIGSSYSVFSQVQVFARGLDSLTGAGSDRSWIDNAVPAGEQVAFLFGGAADPSAESKILWETEFWNRRLTSVYYLGQGEIAAGLPYAPATVDPASGRIAVGASTTPRYVVAPSTLELAGQRIAETPSLTLYKVQSPLRLGGTVDGIYPDGWMGSDATVTRYAPAGKKIRVTLSRTAWGGTDVPGDVRLDVRRFTGASSNGTPGLGKPTAVRTWTIHSGAQKTFTLQALAPPYRIELHIEPTFSPSQFGQPDTRQLGAQVFFGP